MSAAPDIPGMASSGARTRDPLAAIRQKFLVVADRYAIELEILLEDAVIPDQTAEALRDIGGIAHRVAGVAATLGFEALGTLAARLDRQLNAALVDDTPVLAAHEGLIGQFHAALENLLDRGRR
ncbi:Hpt domain-containing protein [Gemmobacter sp.]|uniref:Hpt domain-containing protein n=1 Tax=Gemmobacter sp. TaxID=1898957 RepID=UPI002AFE2786|nr:Hpt domain-containing protein [Gemmobacter sp.]